MQLNIAQQYFNKSGIYIIRNSINNRFYIGSAKNFKKRYRSHINALSINKGNRCLLHFVKKYGIDKLSFDIIEIVNDIKILISREQYYLDTLRPWDKKIGFNISPTAQSSLGVKHTKKTLKKLKKRNQNLKFKEAISKAVSLPIYQKDLNNNIIKKWPSAQKAAKELNICAAAIHLACKKDEKIYKNFKWEYTKEGKEKSKKLKQNITYGLKVLQYSLEGEFIKEWKSAREVSYFLNCDPSHVARLINQKKFFYKNYLWFFAHNIPEINPIFIRDTILKKDKNHIMQFDLNGNLIQEWENYFRAAEFYQKSPSRIRSCCNGILHKTLGFLWFWKKDVFGKDREEIFNIAPKKPKPRRIICQFDLNGNLIQEWDSATPINNMYNKSHYYIGEIIKHEKYFAQGYIWIYKNDKTISILNKLLNK